MKAFVSIRHLRNGDECSEKIFTCGNQEKIELALKARTKLLELKKNEYIQISKEIETIQNNIHTLEERKKKISEKHATHWMRAINEAVFEYKQMANDFFALAEQLREKEKKVEEIKNSFLNNEEIFTSKYKEEQDLEYSKLEENKAKLESKEKEIEDLKQSLLNLSQYLPTEEEVEAKRKEAKKANLRENHKEFLKKGFGIMLQKMKEEAKKQNIELEIEDNIFVLGDVYLSSEQPTKVEENEDKEERKEAEEKTDFESLNDKDINEIINIFKDIQYIDNKESDIKKLINLMLSSPETFLKDFSSLRKEKEKNNNNELSDKERENLKSMLEMSDKISERRKQKAKENK